MLLVIFGAGASYDSAPDYPAPTPDEYRPPLANELFHNRAAFRVTMQKFHQCQELATYLIRKEVNLEAELQVVQSRKTKSIRCREQLAAIRFYLREIIWDTEVAWEKKHSNVTNYRTLLGQIEDWRSDNNEQVCLVTFNYDKMIERALSFMGIHCYELASYISRDTYKLIKVHGSIDWAHATARTLREHRTNETSQIQELITAAGNQTLVVGDDFSVIQRPLVEFENQPNGVVVRRWFPAIAIPVQSKEQFECPQEHEQALRKLMKRVNRIVTIGWKGTEWHFLRLVKEHLSVVPNIITVAGNDTEAAEVTNTITQNGIVGKCLPYGKGFSEFVQTRRIVEFLNDSAPTVSQLLGV
jgi:hypothetical protein